MAEFKSELRAMKRTRGRERKEERLGRYATACLRGIAPDYGPRKCYGGAKERMWYRGKDEDVTGASELEILIGLCIKIESFGVDSPFPSCSPSLIEVGLHRT